jgi:hypothetical protein
VFLQKYYLLRRFFWFLFIVLRFWGISLWHGTHDEQTLACIVLGGCTLVALRLRCGGRSGVTNFCPISGENRASTGGVLLFGDRIGFRTTVFR